MSRPGEDSTSVSQLHRLRVTDRRGKDATEPAAPRETKQNFDWKDVIKKWLMRICGSRTAKRGTSRRGPNRTGTARVWTGRNRGRGPHTLENNSLPAVNGALIILAYLVRIYIQWQLLRRCFVFFFAVRTGDKNRLPDNNDFTIHRLLRWMVAQDPMPRSC